MLAEIGRRSTNQALQRADVDRRHPVLLAMLAETDVEVPRRSRWPRRRGCRGYSCPRC
jgi:hypothetical protein